MRYQQFFGLLLFLILASCEEKEALSISDYSFYHWSTKSQLSSLENQVLEDLKVEKLYYRYFDVDMNKPTGVLVKASENPFKKEIIPCVFITNRSFRGKGAKDIALLAQNVIRKITEMHPYLTPAPIKKIQFDCDWTESTEQNFFLFLEEAQKAVPDIEITSTVRLHQLSRRKSGQIPPVKSGTLMIYNTSDLREMNHEQNSILELDEVEKYIDKLENYPIELDIALPLFSWAVVKNFDYRGASNFDIKEGLRKSDFLAEVSSEDYSVENGIYTITKERLYPEIRGEHYYFSENDKIKFEEIKQEQLQEVIKLIDKHGNKRNLEIIYYHLNSNILEDFSVDQLKIKP